MIRFPILFPFLTLGLAAQTVSPLGYDKKMANGSVHVPFSASSTFGVCRYQQIHGDVAGTPLLVKELAFRRRAGGLTTFEGRKVTLELLIGEGAAKAFGFQFAKNYASSPTVAIAKKEFDLPEMVATSGLQPFVVKLPLDSAWSYSGKAALIWEAKVSKVVRTSVDYPIDCVIGGHTSHDGSTYGTGCNSGATSLSVRLADDSGILRLQPEITSAPSGALGFLLLGATDPDLTIPGLCTKIHCDGAVVLSLPLTQGNGSLPRWPAITVPNQSAYTGLELTHQAFFVDSQRSPIPLSGTNGVRVEVPAPNSSGADVHRLVLSGSSSGALGSVLYGEGVVVQFD
jgi:hypothetical protein